MRDALTVAERKLLRERAKDRNRGLGDGMHCWHGLADDLLVALDEIDRMEADLVRARALLAHPAAVEERVVVERALAMIEADVSHCKEPFDAIKVFLEHWNPLAYAVRALRKVQSKETR